jgi:hypothetical protein
MRVLSKSKILAFRQCAKRLWLEIYRPELREDSPETEARFETGHQVGDIARKLFDPKDTGILVDFKRDGIQSAFDQTAKLLTSPQPIFEAGFSANGALAFADIMLPAGTAGKDGWHMIEVKSSTSVKDYYHEDVAVQSFVARASGVRLATVSLAHIDSKWTYPGGEQYQGLLTKNDLTEESLARDDDVKVWIADAGKIAESKIEPSLKTGSHCSAPYQCGFIGYCLSKEPQAKYPVAVLPRIQTKALKALINDEGIIDLRNVPDELLNDRQRRVKTHTLSGKPFFDAKGAAASLADHKLPAYFMDFETIQFAVPIWPGTRPYQQIPFQFSVHSLSATAKIEHISFLDLSGTDPSRSFAAALVAACGAKGPVFVYNAGFETARIKELAERFPKLKKPLLAINERVVDLLKTAQRFYYHPNQEGSWSIKQVLPTIAPDLDYAKLVGVQDGGMAMSAYQEAIASETEAKRKAVIFEQLEAYCRLDTYALVRLWQYFSGRQNLGL